MDQEAKQRYVRAYEGLRARAKSIRENPDAEAAQLERTADYLKAQLPQIFPNRTREKKPVGKAAKKASKPDKKAQPTVAAKTSRGHYAEDLIRFLAERDPRRSRRRSSRTCGRSTAIRSNPNRFVVS